MIVLRATSVNADETQVNRTWLQQMCENATALVGAWVTARLK